MTKATLLRFQSYASYFAPRPRDWHKGQSGHILIIGGGLGMSGAPRLSAVAAFRVGAGLVTIATHPQHAALLNLLHPEIMCHGISDPLELDPLLAKASVIVLGPGLGQSDWAKSLWQAVCQMALPMLVDADGLNLLAAHKKQKANWVLTPHVGEAARLLNTSTDAIQRDRLSAVAAIAKLYGGVSVLKGAHTLIHTEGAVTSVCEQGNPGMATAGMGDVLSGVIAGLMGQGLESKIAAEVGVLIHAMAGDQSAKDQGERGMMAGDVLPYLRQLVNVG